MPNKKSQIYLILTPALQLLKQTANCLNPDKRPSVEPINPNMHQQFYSLTLFLSFWISASVTVCLIWSCWEQRRSTEKTGQRERERGQSDNQMHGCAGFFCCRYSVMDGGSRPHPLLAESRLQHWRPLSEGRQRKARDWETLYHTPKSKFYTFYWGETVQCLCQNCKRLMRP